PSWVLVMSSSQMIPVASVSHRRSLSSSSLPFPIYVPGWILSLDWISLPATSAPAVRASSASSSREDSAGSSPPVSTPTRITFSLISSISYICPILLLSDSSVRLPSHHSRRMTNTGRGGSFFRL